MTPTNTKEEGMFYSVLVNNWKQELEFIVVLTPEGEIEFEDVSGNKTAVIESMKQDGIEYEGETVTTEDGIDFLWAITNRYNNSSRVSASIPSKTQERPTVS
jgi:hypothetical protein